MERMATYEELMLLRLWKTWQLQADRFNVQLDIEESQWNLSKLNNVA